MRSAFPFFLLILSSLVATAEVGVTDKEILIGGHTMESGKVAIFSNISKAAAAYFDQVNEKGGVNGRKIKYLNIDTQGDQVKSVQAAKKLAEEDNVFSFFLNVGTPHQSTYKYIMEKNIPDMFFTDSLREYTHPYKKSLFIGNMQAYTEAEAYGTLATTKFKGKKLCFLVNDDQMGEEFIAGAKSAIEKGNSTLKDNEKIKVGIIERTDINAPQANTQILKLKKGNCEIVLNGTFRTLGPATLVYAYSQDFKPTWMIHSWNVGTKFVELMPEGAKDAIISSAQFAINDSFNTPGWQNFSATLEKSGIQTHRAQTGWAAAELMTEALKRAGKDLTREKLIQAAETLSNFTCSICMEPHQISSTLHLTYAKPTLTITKAGKWIPYKP